MNLTVATLIVLTLTGCASLPDESDDISEMWAYAYEHRDYDREDSRDVRYVADAQAECLKLGTPVYAMHVTDNRIQANTGIGACTFLGAHNYSILPLRPSAMQIGHEAAHRRYGNWHKGYAYFTRREWVFIKARN